jgi:hypothetical protein
MGKQGELRFWRIIVSICAAAACLLALASSASAARPDLLWQQPEDLASGSGAGRMDDLRGMDVLPSNGHLFIADRLNARINEFDAWGQFVKSWGWGVRDGSSALQTCGQGAVPPSSTCLPGLAGTGPGQLVSPVGVGVGEDGSVYVYEDEECVGGVVCMAQNFRVQKFNAAGEFVLMFGGEVNKTKSAEAGSTPAERNLCTAASGDTCGIGVLGTGPGEFSNRSDLDAIDISPDGTVVVGDAGRIQVFEPSGVLKEEVVGSLAGEIVRSLALDSAGNFFVTLSSTYKRSKDDVRKLTPNGVAASTLPVTDPGAIAIDDEDNVFVTESIEPAPGRLPRVVKFAPDGERLIPDAEEIERLEEKEEEGEIIPAFAEVRPGSFSRLASLATSSACGIDGADVYVGSHYQNEGETYVTAYGPPPDPVICEPPEVPPTITEQFATAVSPDGATLRARINPHFWPDATFYVEYGTGKCSEGGCASKTPEVELGPRVVDVPLTTREVLLESLDPNTTYHYRFVAQSGGGGPVFGGDPDGEGPEEPSPADGTEGTLTTPAPEKQPSTICPNATFRTGLSALLEDCRAYEMVSPVDKNNGDIFTLPDPNSNPAAYDQASVDGSRFGYSAYRAFDEAESSPYTSQYLASRTATGWVNDAISPPRGVSLVSGEGLQTQYRFFSPDLCAGWLFHDSDPKLAEDAVEGFSNLYKRDTCGAGGYEAITTTQPTCFAPRNYLPELQGVSGDGAHAAFRVQDKLTNNAANCVVGGSTNRYQCYESSIGSPLRLISVLPTGVASTGNCTLGSAAQNAVPLRFARVDTAISEDGSRVYWTNLGSNSDGPGTIYVRINASEPQSPISGGVCTNPERACTLPVGEGRFWWASSDGSRALYVTSAGELEEFDLATATSTPIAGEVPGLVGASRDATKVYLASKEVLASGAPASDDAKLYLYQAGGGFTYIATLAKTDLPNQKLNFVPSPLTITPFNHTARVTPDGMHAAFMSTAPLTGEENIDAQSGEPDAEVFIYDAGSGQLSCASCLSTGQRPTGRELRPFASASGGQPSGVWAASQIPGNPTQLYGTRVLSADGQRLFFESFQALVGRDNNGKQDVYEWEAPGDGSDPTNTCTEGSPAYRPANDGCISLISSGTSGIDSEFLDASADGSDVFFTTNSSLVPSDPGQIDVYDARVQGGFPSPPPPTPPCQGEACQNPPPPPNDPTPASSTFHGPGNLQEKAPRRKCPKGKVRKRGKCVKKNKAGKNRQGKKKAGKSGKGARR